MCAQLGREIGKVKKTKSGQATNELHQPSWIHWERLQFLANQMQSGGTRDTTDINASVELNDEVSEAEDNIQPKARLKRKKSKCLEERKMEILEGCSKMLASSVSSKDVDTQQKPSTFAFYDHEKLKLLDNRTRIFTEKRISDILFEEEMASMPSSVPNNYNHPHLRSTNTEITTQPYYWRSMVTSESFE